MTERGTEQERIETLDAQRRAGWAKFYAAREHLTKAARGIATQHRYLLSVINGGAPLRWEVLMALTETLSYGLDEALLDVYSGKEYEEMTTPCLRGASPSDVGAGLPALFERASQGTFDPHTGHVYGCPPEAFATCGCAHLLLNLARVGPLRQDLRPRASHDDERGLLRDLAEETFNTALRDPTPENAQAAITALEDLATAHGLPPE